jgi:DNA (cytosine-5)-methyltransferase 1
MFRFTDFFAGLGGFHLAAAALGGKCVFACEIDERLKKLYESNFQLAPAGDIRAVSARKVPKHELLCAGFPCQPFSKAGMQSGFKDESRGSVFFSLIEVIRYRRPKFLILENVSHFIRHDSGQTYDRIRGAIESEGYEVSYREYSPHQFGIPQIRQRVYLVAAANGLRNFNWPEPQTSQSDLTLRDVLETNPKDARPLSKQVIDCLSVWQQFLKQAPASAKLPSFPIWSMEFRATYPYSKHSSLWKLPLRTLRNYRGSFGRSLCKPDRRQILELVPSHARAKSGAFPTWKQGFIRQNRQFYREHRSWIDEWLPSIKTFPASYQKFEWNCQGEERDLWRYVIQFRASGVRVKRANTAPSLVAMTSTQIPIIAWERRYMTVRECARLQSLDRLQHLPDGNPAVSALGNAVNSEVARRILERLLDCS